MFRCTCPAYSWKFQTAMRFLTCTVCWTENPGLIETEHVSRCVKPHQNPTAMWGPFSGIHRKKRVKSRSTCRRDLEVGINMGRACEGSCKRQHKIWSLGRSGLRVNVLMEVKRQKKRTLTVWAFSIPDSCNVKYVLHHVYILFLNLLSQKYYIFISDFYPDS